MDRGEIAFAKASGDSSPSCDPNIAEDFTVALFLHLRKCLDMFGCFLISASLELRIVILPQHPGSDSTTATKK